MANSRDEIRQRIALEGGDQVKKELADLGAAGEQLPKALTQGASASTAALSALSSGVNTLKSSFAGAREAFAPVREALTDLHGRFQNLGNSLSNLTGNIFPNFKAVVTIGAAASAAGLYELTKNAVFSAKAIQDNASQLGLSVEQFRAYGKAARQAGVDTDAFVNAATRFQANLQKIGEDIQGDLIKAIQLAFGETAKTGIALQGTARSIDGVRQSSAHLFSDITKSFVNLRPIAEAAFAVAGSEAQKAIGSANNILMRWVQTLGEGGEKAATLTEVLNKLKAGLSTQTIFSALNQQLPNFTNELFKLGLTFTDLIGPDGKVRSFQEVFPKFLELFANKTPVEQSRIALDLFGRSGINLLPFLQKGKAALQDFPIVFEKLGIKTNDSTKSIDKAYAAFITLEAGIGLVKKTIGLAFADVFTPVILEIVKAIEGSRKPLKEWATEIAQSALPIVKDFIAVLKNADAEVQNQWVKSAVNGVREFIASFRAALPSIGTAFGAIKSVLDGVASAINAVFGTDFNGTAIAVVAVLGSMTGAFTAVGAAAAVVFGILSTVGAVLGVIAGLVGWPAILLAGLLLLGEALLTFGSAWNNFKITLVAGWDLIKAFGEYLGRQFSNAVGSIGNIFQNAWDLAVYWTQYGIGRISQAIDAVFAKIKAVGDAIASVFGGGGAAIANVTLPPGQAAGGPVIGPGTSTSDSVWRRLSTGEYVVRAAAVRSLGLDFMNRLNALGGSFANSFHGFANGGLIDAFAMPVPRLAFAGGVPPVAAAAAKQQSAFTLQLGNRSFKAFADKDVAESLLRTARKEQMFSIGGPTPLIGRR